MRWELVILPIISALIGWGTNVIAIKMLFWPREAVRIPLLNIEFIGVLPKRQADIAHSIGEILNDEILPIQDLVDAINTKEMRQRVTHLICENMSSKMERYLPRFVPSGVKDMLQHYLFELVSHEIEDLFSHLGTNLGVELQESGLLGQMVEDKIQSFDLQQLEDLVFRIAKTELRYIELFGAVLGFLIGVMQSLFLLLF